MRFTFRQLEYFVAAGDTGSIKAASERISISQPSISAAISHLEAELGVQLFVRLHAQGLSLTAGGRRLLGEAKALLEHADSLYAVANEVSEQVRGRLVLGCLITFAPMVVPELCYKFASAYPETRIRQHEGHQEELLTLLRRAEIDLAITYDLQIPGDIAFEPLAQLPAYALVSARHPLAKRTSVTLRELANEPYILLDLPLSREYFLSMFMTEGLEPDIHSRSAHQDVVRTMVANGYGYTLANARPRANQALDGKRLVILELDGDYRPMVLGMATVHQARKSRLLEAFEAHCRKSISSSGIPGMASTS